MIRRSFVSLFLGSLLAGAVIYFVGWPQDLPTARQVAAHGTQPVLDEKPVPPVGAKNIDIGERLQVAFQQPGQAVPPPIAPFSPTRMSDIVVADCRLSPRTAAEIPSKREGTLLFVGTEISPFDEKHPEYTKLFNALPDGRLEFIGEKADAANAKKYFWMDVPEVAVQVKEPSADLKPADRVFPYPPGTQSEKAQAVYRRWREDDKLETTRFKIFKEKKWFRELSITDHVLKGDLLAVIDPVMIYEEMNNKAAALDAKEADWKATISIRDEAENHWKRTDEAKRRNPQAVSLEEVESALMNYERYRSEAVSKHGLFRVGEKELAQVVTTMRMHFIRAEMDGTVMQIYRKKDEAVKNLEPVLHLNNHGRLLVEGQIGVQYVPYVHKGMPVIVEPTVQQAHLQDLPGHTFEINGVAVNNDLASPRIVSVSEDGSIRIWARDDKGRFAEVDKLIDSSDSKYITPRAVKCVACSPLNCGTNLCITGDNDGNVKIWDLAKKGDKAVVQVLKAHKNSTTACLAFHPTGEFFASGGEDRKIVLWHKTADGWQQSYQFPEGHKGAVTSIQFAGESDLVSAGNDKQVLYWKVGTAAAKLDHRFEHRSGDVSTLGVSPDGTSALFDRGRELHVLDLKDQRTTAVVQNPSGAASFSTLALFSPDGRMILTGQGPDVRLQLWHLPKDSSRAFEMRQLVWNGSPATCAAFSPHRDSSQGFLVTGTRDGRVVVWPIPNSDEVKRPLIATVTAVGEALSPATRDVIIQAELDNTGSARLISGNSATLVIKP